MIWMQLRHYRPGLCAVLPPAGIIVKDNGIPRSDSGVGGSGGGGDDDR